MGNLIPQVDEPGYSRRRSVVGAKPEAANLQHELPISADFVEKLGVARVGDR
jgi:hypothetical protein